MASRPLMSNDESAAWAKEQEANRTIRVRVVCKPPMGNHSYFCAQRPWPPGESEAMVSPAELEELKQDAPTITILSVYKPSESEKETVQPAQ